MKNSIKLVRLAGVDVEINWTVLVIAGLVTVSLAGGLLPAAVPGLDGVAYLSGGLLAALGLLASILVHELGHAVVARRNGVKVRRISLWAFGGVAQLEGEPADPAAEFKIAGVGPAISLLVGLGLLLPAAAVPGVPGATLGWLASINIILAVFNLIPGAPLDGGRVLHAWLWKRHGDRDRATATVSRAGRLIGSGLIGLGIVQFALAGVGGLWTALIGWFLRNAAGAEGRFASLRKDLAAVRVRDVMTPSGPPAAEWMSVGAFIEGHVIGDQRPYYFLAGSDGRAANLVTPQALASVPVDDRFTTSVRNVARSLDTLPSVRAEDPASELIGTLAESSLAIVWDGPMPVGTVTAAQLNQAAATAQLFRGLQGEHQPAA